MLREIFQAFQSRDVSTASGGQSVSAHRCQIFAFFWSRKDVRRLLVGVRCKALVDLRFFIHCLNHYFFPSLLLLSANVICICTLYR